MCWLQVASLHNIFSLLHHCKDSAALKEKVRVARIIILSIVYPIILEFIFYFSCVFHGTNGHFVPLWSTDQILLFDRIFWFVSFLSFSFSVFVCFFSGL